MRFAVRVVFTALLPLSLSGCFALVATGIEQTGVTAAENRSVGRKVDDTVIYTDVTNQFIQADQSDLLGRVTFNVRFARVMLTGNVKNEEEAARAVELTWKAKGVTEVINELVVNPEAGFLDTASDAIVKRNLEARLLITKDVWVINYSMDVQNGTAYMIGRVKDKGELDRALNVARTTKGVKRVVSHLQINPDTAHATTSPNGADTQAPATAPKPAADSNSGKGEIYTGPVYGSGSNDAPADASKQ